MKKRLNLNKSGLGLIGILLIIGTLILTASGVVVWQKKTLPLPIPTPAPSGVEVVPPLHKEIGRTWVQIDPVQCFWNPWEKEWLERYGNDPSEYPSDKPLEIEESEKVIIQQYYEKQEVDIYDVKSVKFKNTTVCRSCSCPQGYTLFLLISNSDMDKMIELGFKKTQ